MFCIRFELLGWEKLVISQGGKVYLRTCFTLLNDLKYTIIKQLLWIGRI